MVLSHAFYCTLIEALKALFEVRKALYEALYEDPYAALYEALMRLLMRLLTEAPY